MSLLGRGGMAAVYRATDTRTGNDVALKVPRTRGDALEAAERLRRLLREARTSVRLVHPHIVRLLGAFDHEGRPCLVMEFVDGEPLSAALDRGVVFPAQDVVRHGEALASALGFAHGLGILHGDVAPDNVLIESESRGGAAKLSDFGLARFAQGPSLHPGVGGAGPVMAGRTAPTFSGTLPYIAPEAIEGRAPDPRSDVFSLGAVLYEMAAGTPPFRGDGAEALADAILRDEAPPLAASGPDVPEELERIIGKALAKDPAARYATAEAMESELRMVGLSIAG